MTILFKLFFVFFKVSCFAVGGAYSFLPVIETETVIKYDWITRGEFLDLAAVSGVLPGAISVKYAAYIGYKLAGIPGLIAALTGLVLPTAIVFLMISNLYKNYHSNVYVIRTMNMVRIAVFAMILAAAFKLLDMKVLLAFPNFIAVLLFFTAFMFFNIHPAFIILTAAATGLIMG